LVGAEQECGWRIGAWGRAAQFINRPRAKHNGKFASTGGSSARFSLSLARETQKMRAATRLAAVLWAG
jgi:hypothetical protein